MKGKLLEESDKNTENYMKGQCTEWLGEIASLLRKPETTHFATLRDEIKMHGWTLEELRPDTSVEIFKMLISMTFSLKKQLKQESENAFIYYKNIMLDLFSPIITEKDQSNHEFIFSLLNCDSKDLWYS